MATIRVSCDEHGDIEATSDDVKLSVCTDNPEWNSYTVKCTADEKHFFTKGADEHILFVLRASGCDVQFWSLPQELAERPAEGDRPLIDHDDLIDAHQLMRDIDAFRGKLDELSGGENFKS